MLQTKKLVSILMLATLLGACSSLFESKNIAANRAQNSTQSTKLCADDKGVFSSCQDMLVESQLRESNSNSANKDLRFSMLNEYTEQMAADMQKDVQGIQINAPIGVASFVYLDSSLQSTSKLGNQLAEYFINDLQQIGLPVTDHQLLDIKAVNDHGDFEVAQGNRQLYSDAKIGYVLLGTMLRNHSGLVLNARIVDFKSKVVVASSSKFLPNLVVNGLM